MQFAASFDTRVGCSRSFLLFTNDLLTLVIALMDLQIWNGDETFEIITFSRHLNILTVLFSGKGRSLLQEWLDIEFKPTAGKSNLKILQNLWMNNPKRSNHHISLQNISTSAWKVGRIGAFTNTVILDIQHLHHTINYTMNFLLIIVLLDQIVCRHTNHHSFVDFLNDAHNSHPSNKYHLLRKS